jgi:nitroimidazol reductase NimA-like FMN-containing flavoprotein (pyridoxamine 5'-phosphate oxidase superfamily)
VVTTVRADGGPHVTPLVAVWLDDAVHFTTGPSEQKAVNLVGNPHVVMTTGCNRWDEGLDVMVEGKAERVTDRATLERLAAAWAPSGTANGGSEWPRAASPTPTLTLMAPCWCSRSSRRRCWRSARACSATRATGRAERLSRASALLRTPAPVGHP